MNDLEAAFPGSSTAIRKLRSRDSAFDQICRDFEEIAAALAVMNKEAHEPDTGLVSDLRSTRDGLHREIQDYLTSDTQIQGDPT